MDTQVALQIIALMGGLGTPAFFVIKWILSDRTATTNFDRKTIGELSKRINNLERRLDEQRDFYERRLREERAEFDTKEALWETEKKAYAVEIATLKDRVRDLDHTVRNVQQVQIKGVEDAKNELHHAVDEQVDKLKP
jgi:hypothetical protein